MKSISADNISLEVLEIADVPFYRWKNREEALLHGLVGALERNRETLKQLALPVTGLCAKALARVTFRNLKVVKLEINECDRYVGYATEEENQSTEAFSQMLQALDGHADRSQKANTFRELRLVNVMEAPCVNIAESGCTEGLFNAVRTLRLNVSDNAVCRRQHHAITLFTMLFRNLECLHSDGMLTQKYLRRINKTCANIQELHLCPKGLFSWSPLPVAKSDGVVVEVNASKLGKIFGASEGKLNTLVINGKPTTQQLRVLGEINPGLEHVGIDIGGESVGGLRLLLGSHCRRIRKLELMICPDIDVEALGTEGWRKLTEAVLSASDELCEVSVKLDADFECTEEHGILPVLQSMLDIVEFLGERARRIVFKAATERFEDFSVVLDTLYRILRTCSTQAKNLWVLEMEFFIQFSVDNRNDDDWYKELYKLFLNEKRKLSKRVPLLDVSLYNMGDSVEEWFELMDA